MIWAVKRWGNSVPGREGVCRRGSEFHSWVELGNWIRKYKLYTAKTFFEINFNEVLHWENKWYFSLLLSFSNFSRWWALSIPMTFELRNKTTRHLKLVHNEQLYIWLSLLFSCCCLLHLFLFFVFIFFIRQHIKYPRLSLNWLCSREWPWDSDPDMY